MRLRVDIDDQTYERLIEDPVNYRRPSTWHAEVLLRRALGLLFPLATSPDLDHPDVAAARPAPEGSEGGRNA